MTSPSVAPFSSPSEPPRTPLHRRRPDLLPPPLSPAPPSPDRPDLASPPKPSDLRLHLHHDPLPPATTASSTSVPRRQPPDLNPPPDRSTNSASATISAIIPTLFSLLDPLSHPSPPPPPLDPSFPLSPAPPHEPRQPSAGHPTSAASSTNSSFTRGHPISSTAASTLRSDRPPHPSLDNRDAETRFPFDAAAHRVRNRVVDSDPCRRPNVPVGESRSGTPVQIHRTITDSSGTRGKIPLA